MPTETLSAGARLVNLALDKWQSAGNAAYDAVQDPAFAAESYHRAYNAAAERDGAIMCHCSECQHRRKYAKRVVMVATAERVQIAPDFDTQSDIGHVTF